LVDGSAGLEKILNRNYTGEQQFSASASAKKSTGELQNRLRQSGSPQLHSAPQAAIDTHFKEF